MLAANNFPGRIDINKRIVEVPKDNALDKKVSGATFLSQGEIHEGKSYMLAPSSSIEEIDFFAHIERPGVQMAKDVFALVNENFETMSTREMGCITVYELSEYSGNDKLRNFLSNNSQYLSRLSFSARSLADLIKDQMINQDQQTCITFSDLNTFSSLCEAINRRIFYDGNFQSLREGAGLNAAGLAFVTGIFLGWGSLIFAFTKLNLFLPPAEAIAFGVIATVGIPLCAAMLGYIFGTRQADRYFNMRVKRIDQILEYLEKNS